jgi:endonuclease/exonuclease/phosphatase family metal-dependent hydrolase
VLRILTYNVHSCIGSDRRSDPTRIAEVIADCRPDIIALQELDIRRARTGGIDQAHAIASHLNMAVHFHPALHVEEEQYGDAILTALPASLVKAGPLPSTGEPRGAIWVSVDVRGVELQVLNTHLGLSRRERLNQVASLLGPVWLGSPYCRSPRILVGDFNAVPRSAAYRLLAGRMKDAYADLAPRKPSPTFPARLPLLRIDHVFLEDTIEVLNVGVCRTGLARTASDHLPLIADIRLPRPDMHTARQPVDSTAAE